MIPLGHLHATVPGERQLVLTDAAVERLDQCREDRTGSVVLGQISEQTPSAGPIEQRHDRGPVEGPQDQVAFEVAGLATLRGLWRAQPDRVEQAERTFRRCFRPENPVFAASASPMQPHVDHVSPAGPPRVLAKTQDPILYQQ